MRDEQEMKKQIKEIDEDDVRGYEELVKFTKKIFDKGNNHKSCKKKNY